MPKSNTISEFREWNKRGNARVSVCDPAIEIDGELYPVANFGKNDFLAELPSKFRTIGASGEACLCFRAAGHDCAQTIDFKIVRIAGDQVAGTFKILKLDQSPVET